MLYSSQKINLISINLISYYVNKGMHFKRQHYAALDLISIDIPHSETLEETRNEPIYNLWN